MRIDLYTKTILTLITLLLAVIALKPILHPESVVAQGNLTGVQVSGNGDEILVYDARSGDIWGYLTNSGEVHRHFKITKPGQPFAQ